MIDPVVERQYSDCKELLALWRTFHDFFVMGIKGEMLSPEKEAQFLEIKSRIAMLHDSFMEALSHDQNIGQEVLNIISRAITLKHLNKQSTADIKKMEIEWHESYLLLNETIGLLEDKRSELGNINEAQYRFSRSAGVARQKVTNVLTSAYFKVAVVLFVVLFSTVGVQFLGFYDFKQLAKVKALRTPFQMFTSLYRSMIDEDFAWPTIDVMKRKNPKAWPAGVEEPRVKNESKDTILGKLPAASVRSILEKSLEYRCEEVRKERSTVEIHTFRLATAKEAREAKDAWRTFRDTADDSLRGQFALVQDAVTGNCVVVINGASPDLVNNIRVNVYNEK